MTGRNNTVYLLLFYLIDLINELNAKNYTTSPLNTCVYRVIVVYTHIVLHFSLFLFSFVKHSFVQSWEVWELNNQMLSTLILTTKL